MRTEWEPEDLIERWTLLEGDLELIGNKTGATRLGFAVLLKYFEIEAQFPDGRADIPTAAAGYVAGQLKIEPSELANYSWSGRTIEYHRAQIRSAFAFRQPTEDDEARLAQRWPTTSARSSSIGTGWSRPSGPAVEPSVWSRPPRASSDGWSGQPCTALSAVSASGSTRACPSASGTASRTWSATTTMTTVCSASSRPTRHG
ncbi:MAG: DUF4158 domain-containing protein [Acidimicrobiales bacterium]